MIMYLSLRYEILSMTVKQKLNKHICIVKKTRIFTEERLLSVDTCGHDDTKYAHK